MSGLIRKYVLKEDIEPEVEPYVKLLFRLIESEKKKTFKRSELLELIKKFSKLLGIPTDYEIYLLELYALNYRSDGDYTNLTKDNFIDPRKQDDRTGKKPKKITNYTSNKYTSSKLPFKGSNLEAYWNRDSLGEQYYVVKSYGWYPVYLFKDNRWYENIEKYSSSTGKQMRQSYPLTRWNPEIDERTILVTRGEMSMLENKADFEDIMKNKQVKILEQQSNLISSKIRTLKSYLQPINIKFKIKSIQLVNDKVVVDIDIYDVLKREGNKALSTPENYIKGEIENVNKEFVEGEVIGLLSKEFKEFLGPKPSEYYQFNFNHLKS